MRSDCPTCARVLLSIAGDVTTVGGVVSAIFEVTGVSVTGVVLTVSTTGSATLAVVAAVSTGCSTVVGGVFSVGGVTMTPAPSAFAKSSEISAGFSADVFSVCADCNCSA